MDYTTCCRAMCSDMFSNCDAVDPTIELRQHHSLYPARDGTYSQEECCSRTQCTQWNVDGGSCPSGKDLRGKEDGHHCSENSCDEDECCQLPSGDGGDDDRDELSPECKDAEEIAGKDGDSLSTETAHIAQCYDADFSADKGDATKWIYKKGKGSCSVCYAALKMIFGPTCGNKDGKCKHCGPAIAAYKDCDVVAPSPDEEGELSLGHKSGANLIASLLVVTAAVMIM